MFVQGRGFSHAAVLLGVAFIADLLFEGSVPTHRARRSRHPTNASLICKSLFRSDLPSKRTKNLRISRKDVPQEKPGIYSTENTIEEGMIEAEATAVWSHAFAKALDGYVHKYACI